MIITKLSVLTGTKLFFLSFAKDGEIIYSVIRLYLVTKLIKRYRPIGIQNHVDPHCL